MCLFDFSVIGHLPQVDWEVRSGRVGLLFKENVVLFLSVILDFYIFSAAKYAIEGNMADKYQAVFGAIFMPTSVINLVAGFVIRPYITKLSDQWERNALPEFAGTVGRLAAIIAALTALAVGGAWILGIPVLSILYPKIAYMLRECRLALTFIILGGAFNAYVNLFYYALIIMQEQKRIFSGLCRCDGSGAPYFFALCTGGGTAGRIAFVSAFDGGTDCLLWTDVACDVPETGTRDIELV